MSVKIVIISLSIIPISSSMSSIISTIDTVPRSFEAKNCL